MTARGYSGGAGDFVTAANQTMAPHPGDAHRRGGPGSSRTLTRLPSSSTQRRMANQGLQDLYDWLGGENWRNSDGWLDPGSDVREWYGLTITSAGDLVSINLISNDLEGEMPESLCNLYCLQHLNLSYNSGLRGWIPEGLGDLSNLKTLHLYSALLTGAIPDSLGQLFSLEELFLHGNHLSGQIPASLGNLKCLRKLFLNSNELVGPVPPELGRLSSLDTLNLSWNNLEGEVPPGVRALRNLQLLSIEGNERLVLSREPQGGGGRGGGGGGGRRGGGAGRPGFETGGSSTAWEAAEEAIELHTASHLAACAQNVSCSAFETDGPLRF
eukprot:jgi/Undpi1/3885/HiC_scaffold_16.g07253.m1